MTLSSITLFLCSKHDAGHIFCEDCQWFKQLFSWRFGECPEFQQWKWSNLLRSPKNALSGYQSFITDPFFPVRFLWLSPGNTTPLPNNLNLCDDFHVLNSIKMHQTYQTFSELFLCSGLERLYHAVRPCWGAWALSGRCKMRCAWAKRQSLLSLWLRDFGFFASKHTVDFCLFGRLSFDSATSKFCICSRQPR